MKRIFLLGTVACLAFAGKKDLPSVRTTHQKRKELSEEETKSLADLYGCPAPKRPWQYWPLGCHQRHSELKEDAEWANIEWQDEEGAVCFFYKKCLKNCRRPTSFTNQCTNPTTNVVHRGIRCNCKCGHACIDAMNNIMNEYADGEEESMNEALMVNDAIVTVTGDHEEAVDGLDDSGNDTDGGFDSDEGEYAARSAEVAGEPFQCPTNIIPSALHPQVQQRCDDWTFCEATKFPCKYPCSRRCRECLQQCPPCNCNPTVSHPCPDPGAVVRAYDSYKQRCGTNVQRQTQDDAAEAHDPEHNPDNDLSSGSD